MVASLICFVVDVVVIVLVIRFRRLLPVAFRGYCAITSVFFSVIIVIIIAVAVD